MLQGLFSASKPWGVAFLAAAAIFATLPSLTHAAPDNTYYKPGTDANGVTRLLANDRYPALYTGQFGDCLGGQSLINVTAFDAAYYADNMTVLFHLTGSTNIKNESVMVYISVDAYGEDRFDLVFNPCSANIKSLCPMNASSPIRAEAIIPVAPANVAGIPNIALVIPDFEGYATLRIYSNSTQTEIGCFQAVMRNGASLSHPKAVAPVLGIFTLVALLASSATAIYGVNVPVMRTHYAHSLSVLVIFETFQSFFFSGALSLEWPSVCAAWWSNFAWAAGIIHIPDMTRSINNFLGTNQGNSSQVGGAASIPVNNNGGLQIYGRSTRDLANEAVAEPMTGQGRMHNFDRRDTEETHDVQGSGYGWYGGVVSIGLPLPGEWSNFTGELSEVGIPASNAFMTGFLWFLIALVIVVGVTIGFKWILEGFSLAKWIRKDRLGFFRDHWIGYVQVAALRTMMVAFFMIMTLSLYQFSITSSAGVLAIAAIVFALFLVGLLGIAAYCCFYRLRPGHYESAPDRVIILHKKIWKFIPTLSFSRQSKEDTANGTVTTRVGSFPLFLIRYVDDNPERESVHEDQFFVKRFGWLLARFRRRRWWFFSLWFIYQFVRACFVGGASKSPETQVIGLLVVDIIGMIVVVIFNPFESSRNTALAVYLLSISKVVTAGLSIAFLPQLKVPRIPATIIGFAIIITQGVVTIAVLILIVLGAISSYMSLTRNREDFKPRKLEDIRFKYFTHLEKAAPDVPPPPPQKPEGPAAPVEPYFSVNSVRRAPKIEDEDADIIADMNNPHSQPNQGGRRSRANSAISTVSGVGGVPFGARVHRASWSSRDFAQWQHEGLGESSIKGEHSRHDSASRANHPPHMPMPITMVPLAQPPHSLSGSRAVSPVREQPTGYASETRTLGREKLDRIC